MHTSDRWFSTFLGSIDSEIVASEVAFVDRVMPPLEFGQMLDLCSGPGRHTATLAAGGYRVIALDIDYNALRWARDAERVHGDMRALPLRDSSVDAVVCMWQSFGQFDDATNRAVLGGIARTLRPGGRLLLDVYNREFYKRTQGDREFERNGRRIEEHRRMEGARLHVSLRYDDGHEDAFNWRLYTPAELAFEARSARLTLLSACCDFDEARAPNAESARMQLVFEREASHRRPAPALRLG